MTLRRLLSIFALTALPVVFAGCSFLGLGSSAKHPVLTRTASVFHLSVGDCIVPPTTVQAQISTIKIVSCHQSHTQEVFALVRDNAGNNYPGATTLQTFATARCLQQFQPYVGDAYEDSSLFYTFLLPSVRSWTSEDRTVVCVITTTGQPLTASVRGSKR